MTLGRLDRQPPQLSNAPVHSDFISQYNQGKQVGEVESRIIPRISARQLIIAGTMGMLRKSIAEKNASLELKV